MSLGKMETEQQVAGLIKKAYDKLKASEPESAAALLDEALHIDFNNEETKYALKSVNWWLEQLDKVKNIKNLYEKGGMILSKFRQYWEYLDQITGNYDLCQYAIRRYVFSYALECFQDLLGEGVNQHDPDLLLLVGRCYKGTGNYDEALKYIEQAVRFKREDGETLAEFADVNALLGETNAAKALFREAFFLSPEKIELRAMESEMIVRLRNKLLHERKLREEELREWIPVYGRLWGVFSVIRELKPIEFGRLKQSIFTLETDCKSNPAKCSILKPRLINRYFWLIDYYTSNNEDPALIEGILLKIKTTDSEIYERYMR
jgi:tetratricopeptide (TPR) repeat protein